MFSGLENGQSAYLQVLERSIINNNNNMEESVVLLRKYRLLQKIGSGSFGSIYVCQHIETHERFAAKLQKKGKSDGQLQYEIKLYQLFHGIAGISRLIDYGSDFENDRIFMIIDLLQLSLEDLFQICEKHLSLATTLQIGMQIITRLEQIHRKGFVHRDIKANNFMTGCGDDKKTVYIIDFGLAKRYRDLKTGQHITIKGGKSLVGTARYASIASHEGYEQCRRDDLQSLGYLLLYFLIGKLPWQGIQIHSKTQKYAEIGRLKKMAAIETLVKPYGEDALVLFRYFEYVKSLKFQEEPHYQYLQKLFKEVLIKRKEENLAFDWERLSYPRRKKR